MVPVVAIQWVVAVPLREQLYGDRVRLLFEIRLNRQRADELRYIDPELAAAATAKTHSIASFVHSRITI